jgi:N-acetylglucosaminyldiphosphoundecaprenol N-acetyl-beta-D-mannosaminyltransferase
MLTKQPWRLQVRKVPCDFITEEKFLALSKAWLQGKEFHHVVTLNPEMVVQAEKNEEFARAVSAAELCLPDGAGLLWAKEYLTHGKRFWQSWINFLKHKQPRVTGVDSVEQLAKLGEELGESLYLLGGTGEQARKTRDRLKRQFPALEIFVGPEHVYNLTGPEKVLQDISEKRPAVILVAYGAPKQTLWIERQRERLAGVKLAIGVGGAFALIAGEVRRAPRLVQRLNLEWSWRLWQEPVRLKRIWRATVSFPALITRVD